MSTKKKIGIVAICLVLLSSIMLGCIERETKLESPQEIIIGSPWAPKSADPYTGGYYLLRNCVVETLVSVDYEGKLAPGLAESWEVSDDGLTWTFHLREGVKFHDGTPFNADAMKSSLERTIEKAAVFKKVPIDSMETKDDYTLKITTKEPFAPLPAYLTKGESAPISSSSFDEKGKFLKPVGTGPFKFESWIPKEELVLVKNDEYWGTKPKLDKVVYKGIPEAPTRILMLEAGELNMARILPTDAVKRLESNKDIKVLTKPIARVRMITFNTQREPFNDKKARQAINYAIDREALIKYVLDDIGTPAKGLFPPVFFWANNDIEGYPHDPEKARKLLEEAGWKDTDADGVLDRNGRPLRITLVTYTERASLPPTAEVIQSQLKEIGIDVDLRVLKSAGAGELRKKGEFDMYLVGRGLLFVPDPDDNMMQDYHSSTPLGGYGGYGYKNERMDELLEKGRVTFDIEERKKIYDELQEIIVDEAPVAYLNYYVNVIAVKSNVHGYQPHPTEYSFHLENVYIE